MNPRHGSSSIRDSVPPMRKSRKQRSKRSYSFGGAKITQCRRIPVEEFDDFQSNLIRKVPKVVQLEFFHSFWLSMQDSILKDDGKDLCPVNLYWVDGAKLFLYWIALYPPYSDFEKYDCCQTTMENIRNWGLYHSKFFLDKYLRPRTYEERRIATERIKPRGALQYVTMIIDGRHSRTLYSSSVAKDHYKAIGVTDRPLNKDSYHSFKLKKPCLNTQMAIGLDMYVEWVSTYSLPSGEWNDIKQLKEDLTSLNGILEQGKDCILLDGGYQSIQEHFAVIMPHRKPLGRELTKGELKENREIGYLRSPIERKFGQLVHRFEIVKGPFRMHDSLFNPCFRIACALSNCLLVNKNKIRDRSVTLHPIFDYAISEDYWHPEPPRTVGLVRPENLYCDRPRWMILKLPRPSDYVEPNVVHRPLDDAVEDQTYVSSDSKSASSEEERLLSVSSLSSFSSTSSDDECEDAEEGDWLYSVDN